MTDEKPNPFDEDYPEDGVKAPESVPEPTTKSVVGPWATEEPTSVVVTLKSGKGYEAPWIVFRGVTTHHVLSLFKGWSVEETKSKYPIVSDAVAALFKEVNGAGLALQQDYEGRGGAPAPRSYGRPSNADNKPVEPDSVSLNFDSGNEPDPMMACDHGVRKLVEWKGEKYHVCPLGKGTDGYCGAIKG